MIRHSMALLVLAVGLNLAGTALGANTTVVLKDGSIVKGEIKKLDAQAVELSGSVGNITIPMNQIEKINSEVSPTTGAGAETPAKPPRVQKLVLKPSVEPEPENPRQGIVAYDKDSIYNHRTLGLGLALGQSTGFGLSGLFCVAPVTLVVTGVPLPDGYNTGAQLQCDVFTRSSRRLYLCAGVSHFKTGEYYSRSVGMG
ncbi:MAG: hypothetical protein HGA76_10205, partial [Candidatus Firestonebacteria bacterium]|nr:hypothetical protein [Candidatus Firestonebacteria bacterium]